MTRVTLDKLCPVAALAGMLLLSACVAGCGDTSASHASNRLADLNEADTSNDDAVPKSQEPATGSIDKPSPPANTAVEPEEPPSATASRRARNISFDTIKFDMEKSDRFVRSMLTPTIKALDSRRVKIRGFMFPTSVRAGINSFILVRDNQECCFGPGAALFDAIAVQMRAGETTEYAYFPITVEGVFHIDPIENPLFGEGPLENSHLYVFRVDDALVSKR